MRASEDTSKPLFQSAQPVWIEGRERERNVTVGFRASFDWNGQGSVKLRATASSLYRALVNGHFAGYGPARAAHGYLRVDDWDITRFLRSGENCVAIEAVGYNLNSYCHIDQRASLQAEVVTYGKTVLASTGAEGAVFRAALLRHRIKKVQRLSPQRCFLEMYRPTPGYDNWLSDTRLPMPEFPVVQASWKLLERGVSYPRFQEQQPVSLIAKGKILRGSPPPDSWSPWDSEGQERHGGWARDELEENFSEFLQTLQVAKSEAHHETLAPLAGITIEDNSFVLVDFGRNQTGFISLHVEALTGARLVLRADEIFTDGDIQGFREGNINSICFDLENGKHQVETIEPYTFRYLKFIALDGEVRLNCALREYANDDVWQTRFQCDDERINDIFAAARQTYRQNALDLFMDCPSRERGGYLADSFFAARAEAIFSGEPRIESNFFQNYQLPVSFANLPAGMIPMCYPADHIRGQFIPNWSLWFVLQLEEFRVRNGSTELIDSLETRVREILEFFRGYENEYGLLESLPGWIFVDWSRANEFVEDVSFATNMLYAGTLDAAARLYGMEELGIKAVKIRESIRSHAEHGDYFCDHAVRASDGLHAVSNCSEACQYYAFYFEVATPHSHPKLWDTLKSDFGPGLMPGQPTKSLHPSNAFVGTLLRFELLSRFGATRQLSEEVILFHHHMAQTTGTLWEHADASASCCHGYQAHVAALLFRDMLGLQSVDNWNRNITVRFTDTPLSHCSGRLMTDSGPIELEWNKVGEALHYSLRSPEEYRVTVENNSGLPLYEITPHGNI